MRYVVAFALLLGLAAFAAGQDLGNQAPVKTPQSYPEGIPGLGRQGGDTIATATVIPAIPYDDVGTTTGYNNDYDEMCPFDANARDVVYEYVAVTTQAVDIDLCGSGYDTKVYVYDDNMSLIACNEDFYFGPPCGMYVSKIENLLLNAGTTYDIVIDGYGSSSGDYILAISEYVPCVVACPAGGFPEGEPPLVDGYVDNHNGGCNTSPGFPFQNLEGDQEGECTLCGVSGWYWSDGNQYRDTDWYVLRMGWGEAIEVTADAEVATAIYELGPQDCVFVDIIQQTIAGPCTVASMSMSGYTIGDLVWFWVGPAVFFPPAGGDTMYDYVVWFSGLDIAIATEPTTWGALKALYN